MQIKTIDQLIAVQPFLQGLDAPYVDLIAGCASNEIVEAGRMLFREGEDSTHFYLIRSGRVALEIYSPDKGTVTILTLQHGDVLGWSWLIPPYRWYFDARATEPTHVISFNAVCIRKKCEEDPRFGYELMKRFAQLLGKQLKAAVVQLTDVYGIRR